ncbi:MAG: hypothetical protein SOX38_08125, partial [Candidatus Limiplasma sp.]|nr:hypothetical protein [Candidatus Limiplasma sp.]
AGLCFPEQKNSGQLYCRRSQGIRSISNFAVSNALSIEERRRAERDGPQSAVCGESAAAQELGLCSVTLIIVFGTVVPNLRFG